MDLDRDVLLRVGAMIVAIIIFAKLTRQSKWSLAGIWEQPSPRSLLVLLAVSSALLWMVTGENSVEKYVGSFLDSFGTVSQLWVLIVMLDLWSGWVSMFTKVPKDVAPETKARRNRTAFGLLLFQLGLPCFLIGMDLPDDFDVTSTAVLICCYTLAIAGLGLSIWGTVKAASQYRFTPREDAAADSRVCLALSFAVGAMCLSVFYVTLRFSFPDHMNSWFVPVVWIASIAGFYSVYRRMLAESYEDADVQISPEEPPATDSESTEPEDSTSSDSADSTE